MLTFCARPIVSATVVFVAIVFAATAASAADPFTPVGDPKAMVVSDQARFTILTPRLIRMEWSPIRQFEDRASLVFIHRLQPVPRFTVTTSGVWLTIATDALTIRYKRNSGAFTEQNLEVRLAVGAKPVVWRPGTIDTGNLLGTTRSLDDVNGQAPTLEPGLVSRNGWVVVDDTARLLYDNGDWPWVTPRPAGTCQDWYFFGFGHDYRGALADFSKVAGRIPMPPRFAFGAWWSPDWAYTDAALKSLVQEFDQHQVPLDVLVVDMDWSGYTWDRNYFPDPPRFLRWVGDRGLRTPLNLHPASGIQPWEDAYPSMARAMGMDPAAQQYVPFNIVDQKFARNYFDLTIRPLEKQGVDFWWLDWQQSDKTTIEGINPTWWINYTFFTDMERQGTRRPLIVHRWGGLGNHRYQVGFSGDTHSTWESLRYLPTFTATAANVGFGYWSHDIGGHMDGLVAPELYTRWVQFGAFSPILRTHTARNPDAEGRIWACPLEYASAMREAFVLRYAMIPYLYTESRRTYDTGVPFFRAMYIDYPDAEEAYASKDQYVFGESLLVAPVLAARSPDTGLSRRSVWLPPGVWIEWHSGRIFQGPSTIERSFALREIPVYVKAGSVVPTQPPMPRSHGRALDPLILTVFPGESGSVRVYEDQGDSVGYQKNEYAFTPVRHHTEEDGTRVIEVLPVEGSFPGMLNERGFEIRLRGTLPPKQILVNGKGAALVDPDERAKQFRLDPRKPELAGPVWWYDGPANTTCVAVAWTKATQRAEVRVSPVLVPASLVNLVDGLPEVLARLADLHALVNLGWPKAVMPDLLVNLTQTGNRMSLNPSSAPLELEALQRGLKPLADIIGKLELTPDARQRARALLSEMR